MSEHAGHCMVLMRRRRVIAMIAHRLHLGMMRRVGMAGRLDTCWRRSPLRVSEAGGDRDERDQGGGDQPEHATLIDVPAGGRSSGYEGAA